MRTVWKFAIAHQKNEVDMPLGSQVLCAGVDGHNLISIWAEVPESDTDKVQRRTFFVFGTGHEIPMIALRYIGTAFSPGNVFVWHVYEIPE